MPANQKPSGFNLSNSLKQHASDPTTQAQDFTSLPPGIDDGVALLKTATIGTYKTGNNQGKQFVRLMGVVVEPDKVQHVQKIWEENPKLPGGGGVKVIGAKEVRVEGKQTSVMFPLCPTKNSKGKETSADENVADMLNMLRRIGGDDFTADIASEDDLKGKLSDLEQAGLYIRFRTRAGDPTKEYPTPRTFEEWLGLAKDYQQDEGQAVADSTGNEEAASDEIDLDALGAAADGGDMDAIEQLTSLAAQVGIEKDSEDNLPGDNWTELAEMIRQTQSGEAPEPEPEKEWEPAKGDVYHYTPIDAKTKKPAVNPKTKKPLRVEIEVTAVDKKKRTIDAKRLDTKAAVKGVKWDDVIRE